MKTSFPRVLFFISAILLSNILNNNTQAQTLISQAVPDSSLGEASSRVLPVGTTTTAEGLPERVSVDGGAVRNNVLFHSFLDFNIGLDQRLDFLPNDNITHIFTRVTGDATSQILGTLGVSGDADLFLLNPNGFFFGADSQLDINGSFFATSADAIAFGEDFTFSAQSPNTPPPTLLTIQPSTLLFNQPNPAGIVNEGRLSVDPGRRIQLIGGEINLSDSTSAKNPQDSIVAPEGLIELGGISEPGSIPFSDEGRIQLPADIDRANVSLNNVRIVVAGAGNGDVALYAHDATLENSRIIAGFNNGQGSLEAQAGNIVIETNGDLVATSGTRIVNGVRANSMGNSGDILVAVGGDLSLNDAEIIALVHEKAEGTIGKIMITVDGDAQLLDNSSIARSLEGRRTEAISSGQQRELQDVDVTVAGTLSLLNSDILNIVREDGDGDAGDLYIQATFLQMETSEGLEGDQQSLISTENEGNGNAGALRIEADKLAIIGPGVSGPSGIVANAGTVIRESRGNAGSILIDVSGPITMTRRGKIESRVRDTIGSAGDITINANTLSLDDVSLIQVRNVRSVGTPGNVTVNLDGALDIRNRSTIATAITAETTAVQSGDRSTGNVTINADSVKLSFLGAIRVSTLGDGDAGNISITTNTIDIDDPYTPDEEVETASGFFSRTRPGATGKGGDIILQTEQLRVSGNAVITTETDNNSPGGNINIGANRVELVNGGQMLASASAQGDAGDITISASNEVAILGNDPIFGAQLANAEARLAAGRISDLRRVINRRGENGVAPSGIYLQSIGTEESAGAAGDLIIQERPGGNLNLTIRDGGEINADTVSTTGGNVSLLNLDTVVLRNGSRITAEAGNAGRAGNGGNIKIAIPDGFLIAVPDENSDIVANAFEGNGGEIDIIALNILGFSDQPEQTPLQRPLSQISASSEFGRDGEVNTETLTVDPSAGLIELPTNTADQSNRIAQRCLIDSGEGLNTFVITGQGGVSPSPADVVRNEAVELVDLGTHIPLNETALNDLSFNTMAAHPITSEAVLNDLAAPIPEAPIPEAPIPAATVLEAQHWEKNAQGEITLIAQGPNVPSNSLTHSQPCTARRSNNT